MNGAHFSGHGIITHMSDIKTKWSTQNCGELIVVVNLVIAESEPLFGADIANLSKASCNLSVIEWQVHLNLCWVREEGFV